MSCNILEVLGEIPLKVPTSPYCWHKGRGLSDLQSSLPFAVIQEGDLP